MNLLIDNRFRSDDISVLAPDQKATRELATEKNTKAPGRYDDRRDRGRRHRRNLGLLAGHRRLAIPAWTFHRGGADHGYAGGVGVGAAAGGLIGALIGMGIPEYEAKRYEGRVKNGGILVSVHCDTSDWIDRAKDILKQAARKIFRRPGKSR